MKKYDLMLEQFHYGTIKKLIEITGTINDFVLNGIKKIITNDRSQLLCRSNGEIFKNDEYVGKIYLDFVVSPDQSFKEIVNYCDYSDDFYKIKIIEEKFMVSVTKVVYIIIRKNLIYT